MVCDMSGFDGNGRAILVKSGGRLVLLRVAGVDGL